MSERVFVNPTGRRVGGIIDTVFTSSWPPGSPEFTEALTDLVGRLEAGYLLYFLIYPEEGEPPPVPQSFAKTCRSFGQGRFYSETKPRALVVDLAANKSLIPLVFFDEDGVLLGLPRALGYTPHYMAKILDRAPDQNTTVHLLQEISFVAYARESEFHLKCADEEQVRALLAALP
jgi:hypothetical protein